MSIYEICPNLTCKVKSNVLDLKPKSCNAFIEKVVDLEILNNIGIKLFM